MKYVNVPFFENFTPICSFLLGFKVGRYGIVRACTIGFGHYLCVFVCIQSNRMRFASIGIMFRPTVKLGDHSVNKNNKLKGKNMYRKPTSQY